MMFLLCSAVMTHMCVLFRPWKQEWVGKPGLTLEFSVWHVCRATPKGVKCYDGEYDNAPGQHSNVRLRSLETFLCSQQPIVLKNALDQIKEYKNIIDRENLNNRV